MEKGITENEWPSSGPSTQQKYDDSDDDNTSARETDNPDEVNREGGDLAGTASGNFDDEN